MRKLSVLLLLILVTSGLRAQDVSFTVKGPKVVSMNERFRLVYEVNEEGSNFSSGDLSAFSILGGPSRSSSTSMSIVNGSFSSSKTISYTYILAPEKEGKFTISPGTITVDGKVYKSNSLTIEVVKGSSGSSASNAAGSTQTTVQEVSDNELFVRLETSKRSTYKGEAIVGKIKLYTRVQLQELSDIKIPQFDGFWREEIERKDRNVNWQRENVNGQVYHSGVISEFVLIPQRTGKLTIEPIELEVVALQEVRQQRRGRGVFNDPFFDDFFNRRGFQPVQKKLKSSAVTINVKDIPAAADITGDFKIISDISKTEVKANESVSVKVAVSGKGNLKMIEPLEIPFPEDFEKFDPETNQRVKVSASGISGKVTFEYLVIPRHAGTYKIPSVTLTAFNPVTGKLEELSTKAFELKVNKGDGTSEIAGVDHSKGQEDIKFIGKDIRYIKTGDISLSSETGTWFGSTSFYLSYLLSSGAFLLLFAYLKKQRKDQEDQVGYKKRKAGALARKKLKIAEQHLKENQSGVFYKELLQGMYGYLEDKLNIQKSALSKGKVREELEKRMVSETAVRNLFSAIEKCELAQYAPSASNSALNEDFQACVEVISNLEQEIKA